MDCIFCKISNGQAPASFVYEDEYVFGIMSLDQPNPYKVLVIPRVHIENIYDLSESEAARIFQVTVKVARAIREASGCDGLNLVQSNGRAGQQEVFHFHLHLIPRFLGDDIFLKWQYTQIERDELNRMAEEIHSKARDWKYS
ncbi:MAG: HIT family protein [Acidobacteria bacterium]|nr:HIT family protein [Acidobacteriota bacterium]MCA1638636.1 HIT family protein [Acidobacteriota bacterium]